MLRISRWARSGVPQHTVTQAEKLEIPDGLSMSELHPQNAQAPNRNLNLHAGSRKITRPKNP